MFGWILQKNPVDSDTSIVALPLSPPASSRSTLSSSSVNVCGVESSFVTVTSVGPDTVIVDGWNVKPWITISFSPPPPVVSPVAPPFVAPVAPPFPSSSPPHAANISESANTTAIRRNHVVERIDRSFLAGRSSLNGWGYYEARRASDRSAYTCVADGLHRRQDAVARPVRRGGPHRTVHWLYGVHRRLSLPRARLRERRTRAVAGRRPGRVHSRRSRLRHPHPGLPSVPRMGGRDRPPPVRPHPRPGGRDRPAPGDRPRPRRVGRGVDARPGRRCRVRTADLGNEQRRDRRGTHVEAVRGPSLGRRANGRHRRARRPRDGRLALYVLGEPAGTDEGRRDGTVEARDRGDVVSGERDRFAECASRQQVGAE